MARNTGSANTDIVALLGGQTLDGAAAIDGVANRTLHVSTTQAATGANTDATDLWTYSLPANTLSADGKGLRVTVFGTFAANGNTKIVKVKFGATEVVSYSNVAQNVWTATIPVLRTGASAQLANGTFVAGAGLSHANISVTTPAADTTAAITISVVGQNGTANASDIVFRGAIVEAIGIAS
jgi:hypothetical protein